MLCVGLTEDKDAGGKGPSVQRLTLADHNVTKVIKTHITIYHFLQAASPIQHLCCPDEQPVKSVRRGVMLEPLVLEYIQLFQLMFDNVPPHGLLDPTDRAAPVQRHARVHGCALVTAQRKARHRWAAGTDGAGKKLVLCCHKAVGPKNSPCHLDPWVLQSLQ